MSRVTDLARLLAVTAVTAVTAVLAAPAPGPAVEIRTFDARDFRDWDHPRGLITVESEGIRVRRFGGAYNAVSDIDQYGLPAAGVHGTEAVRAASGAATRSRMIDLDESTWWQPEAADPLESWWFELDLGRAVVANKIRLVFPDTVGARPFSQFTLYTSVGLEVRLARGNVVFERVGRPINGNRSRVVEIDLETVDAATATASFLTTSDTLDFRVVRFLRFEATGKTRDAALAEIEVETPGFNLATRITTDYRKAEGQEVWGGGARTSNERECTNVCGKASAADGLIDADMGGLYWTIEGAAAEEWRTWGHWAVFDLAQVFRVDRLLWIPSITGSGRFLYGAGDPFRQGGWTTTDMLISDGTPDNRSDPSVEGPYEYDLLTSISNSGRNFFDLRFEPREVRLLMFRRMELSGAWAKALQMFIFAAEGFPAKVTMESADIDLGGVFSVRQVEWDADVPPSTRVEVLTQTGDGFTEVRRWFLKNGDSLSTKEAWEAQRSRNRVYYFADGTEASSSSAWENASAARQGDGGLGRTLRDESWTAWSPAHAFSGQPFQSPTPRRWVRLRVSLSSEERDVFPVLRSVRFVMNSPVVGDGLFGELSPREALLDTLQEFTYRLKPLASNDDVGFDRVVVVVPRDAADADLVRVRIGEEEDASATGQLRGDSLVVELGRTVLHDSVDVVFRSRVFQSPTVFEAFVGHSTQTDNLQGVRPPATGLDQVFVPEVLESKSLFHNLEYTRVFTPNGDGVNDRFQLTFNILRADVQTFGGAPQVHVYDLGGRPVAEVPSAVPVTGRARFEWDGQVAGGGLAPPGIYLVRIEMDTDARDEVAQRLVTLIY